MTITDSENATGFAEADVTVNNVAPTATIAGTSAEVAVNTPINLSSVVLDPGTKDVLTWSWQLTRDGLPVSTSAAKPFAVPTTLPGVYSVSLQVSDDDGGVSTLDTRSFVVNGAALVPDPGDPTRTALLFGGTTQDDAMTVSAARGGRVAVDLSRGGVSIYSGTFQPTGHVVVLGRDGADNIYAAVPNFSCMIFGGAGGDTIRSGGNADVLVGGDGNDDLIAGSDRDVLVGGNGADTLTSGNGEDILVAGRTSYDDPTAANLQALAKIQNEWTRTDAAYSVRFWHLAGTLATGGLNGTFLLKVQTAGKTVFDDAAPDVLTGGGGTDWFIARRAQAVKDNVIFVAGETVTEV